jgi:hypothetical protein
MTKKRVYLVDRLIYGNYLKESFDRYPEWEESKTNWRFFGETVLKGNWDFLINHMVPYISLHTKPQNKSIPFKIKNDKVRVNIHDYPFSKLHNNEKRIVGIFPDPDCIGDKDRMFETLLDYFLEHSELKIFDYVPLTFIIKDNESRNLFEEYCKISSPEDIWIYKPTNDWAGKGIGLVRNSEYKSIHSKLVQQYLTNVVLYSSLKDNFQVKRKFDLRIMAMIMDYDFYKETSSNLKLFMYKEGFVRLTNKPFTTQSIDDLTIHLTNNALQKQTDVNPEYGKYEEGNLATFEDLKEFLILQGYNYEEIYQQWVDITRILFRAASKHISVNKNKNLRCFEIFGLDILLTYQDNQNIKSILLEANTNPGLGSTIKWADDLGRKIIDDMIDLSLNKKSVNQTNWELIDII